MSVVLALVHGYGMIQQIANSTGESARYSTNKTARDHGTMFRLAKGELIEIIP